MAGRYQQGIGTASDLVGQARKLSVLAATTRYMQLTGTFARGTKNAEFQPHRALGRC